MVYATTTNPFGRAGRCNVGCTLSPSAFGKSLRREFPKTRLVECDSLHSCQELSILAPHEATARRDTRPLCRLYTLTEYIWQVSSESWPRQDWTSATLYTLAERSQYWCMPRGDSQARHDNALTRQPLKKRDLNKTRHERRGYTTGSKARPSVPYTLSLLLCFRFLWRECTASIRLVHHGPLKKVRT